MYQKLFCNDLSLIWFYLCLGLLTYKSHNCYPDCQNILKALRIIKDGEPSLLCSETIQASMVILST